jgi:vanillate O-demethylase monooxygenase subunit
MARYLENVWYLAAWDHELQADDVLARRLLDRPVVMFRKSDGTVVALDDKCPHRFAPLSRGKRVGDALQCGYHGLTFNASGASIKNFFSDQIPPNAKVTSYPTKVLHRGVWIWFGEAGRADPALIPDLSFVEDEMLSIHRITVRANYELVTDNLMDLSHAEFVHAESFRLGGIMFNGQHSVVEEGDDIWSNWLMTDLPPPPSAPQDETVDRWLDMRWSAPAVMVQRMGIVPSGSPPRGAAPHNFSMHVITPETAASSHYFHSYFTGMPKTPEQAEPPRAFTEEDEPMLEAVQRTLGDVDFWDHKPVILNIDAASIRVRRRLAGLIAAETRVSEADRGGAPA